MIDRRSPHIAAWLLVALLPLSVARADREKGRGSVKDFEFSFKPVNRQLSTVPQISVCVLPVINATDLSRHTKNTEKALRNMTSEEATRLLGIRYLSSGKPQNRYLVPEPFENTIHSAIVSELEALGLSVTSSPISRPPDNLRERTLGSMLESFDPGDLPDVLLAVEIVDFFFETTQGFTKLKMETFFGLEVAVLDTGSREIVWEDRVEAGDLDKKAIWMGKTAVETRLDVAFQDLIENVLRNNQDLQRVLQDL